MKKRVQSKVYKGLKLFAIFYSINIFHPTNFFTEISDKEKVLKFQKNIRKGNIKYLGKCLIGIIIKTRSICFIYFNIARFQTTRDFKLPT